MTTSDKERLGGWLDEIIEAVRYGLREGASYVPIPMTAEDLANLEQMRTLIGTPKREKISLTGPFREFAEKINDPAFTEALLGFVELRHKKRCPLTDLAMKRAVTKLESLSGGNVSKMTAILLHVIDRGWTGIYFGDSNSRYAPAPQREGGSFQTDEFFEAALNRALEKHEKEIAHDY